MPIINRIETDQCCKQAPIRLGYARPTEIALASKPFFKLIERCKNRAHGLLIGGLRGCKTRPVDAVIDAVIYLSVEAIDLAAKIFGIVIAGLCANAVNALLNIRMISADSLFTMLLVCLSHNAGTVTRPE